MWVYIRSRYEQQFTVGFYAPNGEWHTDSDWMEQADAARRAAWLNGNALANVDRFGLELLLKEALLHVRS